MKTINLIQILKKLNIPFVKGPDKNVAEDVIGINCPWCHDTTHHLGIFPSGYWSCWKCKRRGNFYDLLKHLKGLSWSDYQTLLQNGNLNVSFQSLLSTIQSQLFKTRERDIISPSQQSFPLPPNREPLTRWINVSPVSEWFAKRKFTLEHGLLWGAKYCPSGQYGWRLILPILDENKNYVGFQARDVLDKPERIKYLHPKGFQIGNYLYGMYRTDDTIIVVEGILDVWRVGFGAVASFSKGLTHKQREILYKSNKQIILAWDGDSHAEILKEANWWKEIGRSAKPIFLPKEHDPDSFIRDEGEEEWQKLLKK